jgi:hypothetical protein
MGEPSSVDPELEALAERIEATRAEIASVKAARARIEECIAADPTASALDALRAKVDGAQARLAEIERLPRATALSPEASARRGLYIAGAFVAIPGATTLGLAVRESLRHPEEKLDPTLLAILSIPLLLGLALLARARFANYRASSGDLDGDFLP